MMKKAHIENHFQARFQSLTRYLLKNSAIIVKLQRMMLSIGCCE